MYMETKLSITEKEVSQAIVFLLQEVRELKEVVNGKGSVERVPIGIKEACIILQKAKPTVYKMAKNCEIPCYKQGKKLYFYKDVLLGSIEKGRVIRKCN